MLVGYAPEPTSVRTPMVRELVRNRVDRRENALVEIESDQPAPEPRAGPRPTASPFLAEYLTLGDRCDYLEELFDLAPGAYLVTNLKGVIRRANQASGALLGVAPAFLVGKPLAVFVPIEQRQSFRWQVNRFSRGERSLAWDGAIRPRHAAACPVSCNVQLAGSDQPEADELLWLLHRLPAGHRPTSADEGGRALASRPVASAVVPVATLAGLAQDLRNPLGIIADQSAFLAETLVGARLGEVGDVALGLTSLLALANQVLAALDEVADYAAFRSDRPLVLHSIPTDLIAVAHRVVQTWGDRTERHLLGFAVEERALRGIIGEWDEERLERVLENVVGEVVAHGDVAEPITLRLDRTDEVSGSRAYLAVEYTPEDQRATTLESHNGWETGRTHGRLRGESLGLTGAQWILEQLGGRLSEESRPDGRHTLRIELDLAGCAAGHQPNRNEGQRI